MTGQRTRRRTNRFALALSAAAGAPAVAAILFVVHMRLWIGIAQRNGVATTDWGFAIVIALLQALLALLAAAAALFAWNGRDRSVRRLGGSAVVAGVDLVAVWMGLPMGPHYLVSDLPNMAAAVLTVATLGWLYAVAVRR